MKKLILIRHAKTEQLYDYNKTDFGRKLLPRGHDDAELIANQLLNKEIKPDLIISSNAARALQTAKIFAKQMNYNPKQIIEEPFIYDGYTTGEMLNYLSKTDDNIESIMLIGHNPDIASLTIRLISDDIWNFPTCSTSVINFNIDSWKDIEVNTGKLELYIYPSMFKN